MYNMAKKVKIIQCFKCGKEIIGPSMVMDINPKTKELGKLHEACWRILYSKK